MVELPPLLLTANIASVMKICAQIEDTTDPVVCDATRLLVAPFWQGAVVSLELRLPALNNLNFFEITGRYNPDPNLPIRFI